MSKHFHPIRVKEVRRETPECVSVLLDIPHELKETFRFQQGQNLSFRTTLAGEELRRTYSICSSPLDQEWRVAIKKVEGGVFSSFANEQLKAGDVLDVMPPAGRFNTPLAADQQKRYLGIAAGSGITPILSLVKTILATEPKSEFTLVYGNRHRGSIIFFEELEALKNKYMDRFTLIHVLSREIAETPINAGRITGKKLEELSPLIRFAKQDECFLCGPEEMIFAAKEFLEKAGIPKTNIHFELFNSKGKSSSTQATPLTDKQASAELLLTIDGRTLQLNIPRDPSISLLDAATAQGADLPYACKGGMCCTCKAKLVEGEVKMEVHWGLEEEELKKGYILTCQSHPVSERIVVNFDL